MLLENRVALVTGGSRGIGRATCLELARQGAAVAVNYSGSEDKAEEVVRLIRDMGQRAWAIKADVSDPDQAESLVAETLSVGGRIDILVNNAGITRDNLLMRMKQDEWVDVMAVNIGGVFNCTRAAIRPMLRQKSGRIINVSSVVALTGNPGQANYCAAKAGVLGFTRAVAKEVASRGITVNAVAPGFIETDMTGRLSEEQRAALVDMIPMGHTGTPEDIAMAIAFLSGPHASYITGQTLVVDGGLSMLGA